MIPNSLFLIPHSLFSQPPMTYLIVGGAGFIGSHIAEALIKKGEKVRVLDNLSTGRRENVPHEAEFFQADIRNPKKIAPAFEGADGVFLTAALPRVQFSVENPIETNDVNITGCLNVILACREAKVKRLVYSASSSAYGNADTMPLDEEMKPRPMSPYGLQKYVGEEYAKLASMFWGVETVSLRYFNVYGPRMASEGAYVTVLAIFARQKMAGEPLTITGDGTQTRDFTYIDDVVRANILAMESAQVGKGEVMNIGNGDNHSVNEVAKLVGGPVHHIAPRVEPHDTRADVSRARTIIGWKPEVSFLEGFKRTMKWYGLE